MICFEHICKNFRNVNVLNDISFRIETGELVAIIGSSGCGKTTLLKMINKLISPSSGYISIDETDILELPTTQLRRNMGYVIQQTGLFIHMTVGKNIGTIPMLQKEPKNQVKRRVCEMMELVGLPPDDFYDRYPPQLSGGQQQRVGVARAFVTNPDIILMDEPFSALDPLTRIQLQNELIHLHKKLKKTIVFVTHDIDEALKIADRICILRDGRIEQYDTPEEILLHPKTDYVSSFIGNGRIWNFPYYLTAGNIMDSGILTCHPDTVLQSIPKPSPYNDIYVVDSRNRLMGIITASVYTENIHRTAMEVMETDFPIIRKDEKLISALSWIEQSSFAHIPVVDNDFPAGFISQKSLMEAIIHHREEASGI